MPVQSAQYWSFTKFFITKSFSHRMQFFSISMSLSFCSDWKAEHFRSKNPLTCACFWRFSQPDWLDKKHSACSPVDCSDSQVRETSSRALAAQQPDPSFYTQPLFTVSNGSPLATNWQPFLLLTIDRVKKWAEIFLKKWSVYPSSTL